MVKRAVQALVSGLVLAVRAESKEVLEQTCISATVGVDFST